MSKKKRPKLEDFNQSRPLQMQLFELPSGRHSNLVDLYDAAPKYHYGRPEKINGRFLNQLKRAFEYQGATYDVVLSPGRVEDSDGLDRDYYPGEREELIEDALRKLAVSGKGVYLDDGKTSPHASVVFTLYELQQELKRSGHTYSISELKHGIEVCVSCNLTIVSENNDDIAKLRSGLFREAGFVSRKGFRENPDSRCFVLFHRLVTMGIDSRAFRRFDYDMAMRYRRALARWTHKRLALVFSQAEQGKPYSILLSTILRWSGCKEYASLSDNIRDVRLALDEMADKGVLASYEVDVRKAGRKIVDALFTLHVSQSFIQDTIEANRIQLGVKYGVGPVEPPGPLRLSSPSSDAGEDEVQIQSFAASKHSRGRSRPAELRH